MWWKRLTNKAVEMEARQMVSLLGDQAYESAREEARRLRGKDRARSKTLSLVALRIAELTGREVGLDTATRMAEGSGPRIVDRITRHS